MLVGSILWAMKEHDAKYRWQARTSLRTEPPRPRISSPCSLPSSLSRSSVPKSRPPLGQSGRSFVVTTFLCPRTTGPFWKVRVPSHRASSSDAAPECPYSLLVASVCPCSLGASERVPEQPTARRRTEHPIRKVPTTAMRRAWRTVAPSPSLCMCSLLLDLAGAHKPHHHQEGRRHRQPRQPYNRTHRNDPRGVG